MKKALIVLLMVLWPLVTNHCRLEVIPGLQFFACLSEESETHHDPSDCDTDSCATVESSVYKSEETQGYHPVPPSGPILPENPFAPSLVLERNIRFTIPPPTGPPPRPSPLVTLRFIISPRAPALPA